MGIKIGDPFYDVPDTEGYYDPVIWAYTNGIVKGLSGYPQIFDPKGTCTRGQLATMLYRLSGEPEIELPEESPFTDVETTEGYYKPIYWAYKNGYVNGYKQTDGTYKFKPKNDCTRAQVVIILYKMAGKP